MARAKPTTMSALHKFAVRLPGTDESIACEGTPLEARTIRTGGKAFLFLRPIDARFKLVASLKEAQTMQAREPKRYVVGKGGWIHVRFDDATDRVDLLERWIVESHSLYFVEASGTKSNEAATRGAGRKPAKRKS